MRLRQQRRRQWWQCGGDVNSNGNGEGDGNGNDGDLKVGFWCGFDVVFCGVHMLYYCYPVTSGM
jgi:hypothetical protein